MCPDFCRESTRSTAGIIRHGAKLLHAWTEATVPKISCILRKMYGGAIPAMGVHQIGFDQVFAWPCAEMQMLGAEPSVKILYRRELAAAEDPEAFLAAEDRRISKPLFDALPCRVSCGHRCCHSSRGHPQANHFRFGDPGRQGRRKKAVSETHKYSAVSSAKRSHGQGGDAWTRLGKKGRPGRSPH